MTSVRILPAITIALACFILAGCGGGESAAPTVPEKAMTDDVAGVAWIDVDRLAPEKLEAAATAFIDAIPTDSEMLSNIAEQMRSGLDEAISDYRLTHDKLTVAGVEGAILGMLPPSEPQGEPERFMLVKVAGDAQSDAVREAIRGLDADAPGPDFDLVGYADGWLAAQPKADASADLVAAPTGGSADNASAFAELLETGKNTLPFAFRLNEAAREQLRKNPPRQLGPIAPTLADAEHGSVNLTLGSSPALNLNLGFASAKAADEFASMLNGLLTASKNQVKAQMAQAADSPEPARVDSLFDKLKVKAQGGKATMSVDIGTVEQAMAIAHDAGMLEQMVGMVMMMMGGPGGMPGPGPGPGGPMGPGGGMDGGMNGGMDGGGTGEMPEY